MAESIGVVYASALSQLSFEENCEEQVYLQMQELSAVFAQNEEYLSLLSAPVLSGSEKVQMVNQVFEGRVLPLVLNFLKVLAENGRFDCFAEIAKQVKEMYLSSRGIKEAIVTTAKELSDDQVSKLKEALSKKLNAEVLIDQKVDKNLLGGIRVEFDGKQLDASVAARLRQIEHTIKEGV